MLTELQEYRCKNCDRLLCELSVQEGTVRHVCPKCGTINVFEVKPAITLMELLRAILHRDE